MLILLQCILKPGPTLELPVLEEEVYGDAQGAKQVKTYWGTKIPR